MNKKRQSKLANALSGFDTRPSSGAPDTPKKTARTSQKKKKSVKKPEPSPQNVRTPARVGKKMVAGHFPPEVAQQLKVLAAQNDTSNQALLAEALNLLFAKYGRSEIA